MSEISMSQPSADAGSVSVDSSQQAPVSRGHSFNDSELRQLAQWSVESGSLTPERANEMLRADGVKVEAPTQKTQLQTEFDHGFPPASPSDFKMPKIDGEISEDVETAFELTRNALSLGRFPEGIGNFVTEEMYAAHKTTERMTADEYRVWQQGEFRKLQNIFKGECSSKIELAQMLIREIEAKTPGFIDLLEVTRAGDSAAVIMQFANQAERLAARSGWGSR